MRRGGYLDRHPAVAVLCGLFALGLVIEHWAVAILAAMTFCAVKAGQHYLRHRDEQRRLDTAVAARADWEHQQYLAGNSIGWYGQYPPAR
ncbi:hypothetical protein CH302_19175 [Rhodococcus sp. 15-2388-1-1a]|uniref:hypothetical protein n=1 Tax=Nocardiaceae TaxID=85025 RepID=UPI00056D3007|nr:MULTISPECIES: hypothetical protein [Rhodococcus]OZE95064.1 hypothetical protein CH302_19175 [Rhodococcus sp. 15-2388-1-1a]